MGAAFTYKTTEPEHRDN